MTAHDPKLRGRWPRLLKLASAAEYVEMTPAAFEREVAAGRFPAAVTVGAREHWDRRALDRAIDNLVGEPTNDYRQRLRDRLNAA